MYTIRLPGLDEQGNEVQACLGSMRSLIVHREDTITATVAPTISKTLQVQEGVAHVPGGGGGVSVCGILTSLPATGEASPDWDRVARLLVASAMFAFGRRRSSQRRRNKLRRSSQGFPRAGCPATTMDNATEKTS